MVAAMSATIREITYEQLQELALGLEESEQRFIWVLRVADKGDIFAGEVLRTGIAVRDWDRRDELVPSPRIQEAVETLMASKEGDEIRERAVELDPAVRKSMEEGGITRMEFDAFIVHITREVYSSS
ncbi:hypothetical protein RJ640_001073 [Escallonia rubra]|uniref:Uncharacterized protein n=1 Tax=Escallonia rubra TaxID=112253 RepID=A0AA88U0H4_9ASTE|nr:hypothetical protein RJ640_001073 [Escallonia rubra]